MKKLIKIPLQFFGETDDDFDDNLDYEDDVDYNDDPDDGYDVEDVEDGYDDDAEPTGEDAGDDAPAEPSKPANNDHADLIADLKALGFKGDDLDAIKASVKARRAAREKNAAAEERAATLAAGKSHVKGSKPQKGAGGDGTGGITERQVVSFSERTGCTKEEARKLLAKHSRLMSN